ncbi:hypothetical protein [Nocardioides alcanivorans]|uniref:hypothetical protein n=1 Tax=Nocardioides alcanivorans TaxID=2897352 RepID=UPI001F38F762|nr:hypothetical protein [Nocardioides alcanivorans]
MNDEINIPVSLPLDADGFLRRECPNCEEEFKWFSHAEGDPDAEQVDQYFCPRCGQGAGLDSWWTPAQLEYAHGAAAPAIDDFVNGALDDLFKGLNSKHLKVKRSGRYSSGTPTPESLHEPDDMVIVESPCHPNEPVKVSGDATDRVYCLVCGSPFAA